EDARLVVDQHGLLARLARDDLVEVVLLVNVDAYAPGDGGGEPRALDFAPLEDVVAVGEDTHGAQGGEMTQRVERVGIEDARKGQAVEDLSDVLSLVRAARLGGVALRRQRQVNNIAL